MRKLLLIGALVLSAAAAFAQTTPAAAPSMVFTGTLYTGTVAQSFNGEQPTLAIWDPVNQTQSRFNFQGKFDAGSYGLAFRLREDDNWEQLGDANNPVFRRLYGWMDAANGIVRLAAGRLSGYEWATGDAASGFASTFGCLDGAVGLQLQIKPMDGLNFGAFLPFTYGPQNNAQDQLIVSPKYVYSENIVDALDTMAFGIKYTAKGIGDVEGGYWLAPNFAQNTLSSANGGSTDSSDFYQYPALWFGAEYTGMQNLTALLEVWVPTTGNADLDYGYFDEQFAYQMNALGLALYAEQLIFGNSSFGTDLAFRPVVDYTLGMWDVGIFGEIEYVSSSNFFSTTGGPGPAYNGHFGYSAGPFVKMNVAKGAYCQLQAEFGAGNVTPPPEGTPLEDYPGFNESPGIGSGGPQYGQEGQPWSPLQGPFWQVGFNFVVSF